MVTTAGYARTRIWDRKFEIVGGASTNGPRVEAGIDPECRRHPVERSDAARARSDVARSRSDRGRAITDPPAHNHRWTVKICDTWSRHHRFVRSNRGATPRACVSTLRERGRRGKRQWRSLATQRSPYVVCTSPTGRLRRSKQWAVPRIVRGIEGIFQRSLEHQ